MSKFITRLTYWFFAFISVWIFIGKVYVLNLKQMIIYIPTLAAVLFAGLLALKKLKPYLKNIAKKLSPWQMALAVFVLAFAARLVTVCTLQCDFSVHEDLSAPHRFLTQLLEKGIIYKDTDYALMYGRYVSLTLFCYPWAILFGSSYVSLGCYYALLYSLSYVAWFYIIKRYTGKSAAFYGVLFFSLLTPEVWLSNFQNHEAVLYFGITAFTWVLFDGLPRFNNKTVKLTLLLLGGVALGIGTSCNPMGYVAVIAFVLFAVAKLFKNKLNKASVLKCAVVFLLLLSTIFSTMALVSQLGNTTMLCTSYTSDRRGDKVTYGWSWYVGASYDSCGVWNLLDYENYFPTAEKVPDDKLYDHQLSLIKERFAWYKENPLRYAKHLFNKVSNAYGFYKDGITRTNNYGDINVSQKFIHLASMAFYCVGFLMQILLLLTFKRGEQDTVKPQLFLKLFISGVFLLLLFIEITPKYVNYLWALMFWITLLDYKSIFQNSLLKKLHLTNN